MNKYLFGPVIVAIFLSFSSWAQDKSANTDSDASKVITIETTTIRGNQELPTVLYLVPWQAPKINPLPASQTADLNNNQPEKIERNSFQRLVRYHQMFNASHK